MVRSYKGNAEWQLYHKKNHICPYSHFLVMALLATTLYYYVYDKGTALLLSGVAGAVSGAIPLFSFALAILFLPGSFY